LFYFPSGNGELILENQSFPIQTNTLVFLPPLSKYRFHFKTPNETNIYVFNFDLVDDFSAKNRSLGTATPTDFDESRAPKYELPKEFASPIVRENGLHVKSLISQSVELFLRKEPYYAHTASANLKLILIETLKDYKNDSPENRLAQSVIEYVQENYAQSDLSNETIAEHFHYHPYHLNRVLKAVTKKTLHNYLLNYRIHIAKNLLVTTALNVTMVAERTGFASYTYFIKLFRERTGLSPRQYRNKKSGL
jgi:AraC-like DNA-binding protein